MEAVIHYLDKTQIEKLKRCLRSFHSKISADPKYTERKFWDNKQWEFFEEYFKKYAEKDMLALSEWIHQKYPEVKKTISTGEIYQFLHERVFYNLTFSNIPVLVFTEEHKEGSGMVATFEPRNITLNSIVKDEREMGEIVAYFDQGVAGGVNFYKSHKSVAIIEAANVKIEDPEFEWEFANTFFLPQKSELLKKHIARVSSNPASHGIGIGEEFSNVALIHLDGSSSHRAFALSLTYFNRVFGVLRMLAMLRLNRQYWTTRDRLEIPNKSPAFIGSSDNPMWMAINPDIDNDFFVAVQENSIYLPIVLNQTNAQAIQGFEYFDSVTKLLGRAFREETYSIDEKVYDALSWFSESLKNFAPLHKIVGLITALETLLTNKRLTGGISDKGISELFSERGAIILFDDYENRLKTKKRLKEIYGLRSLIVHGSSRKLARSTDEMSTYVYEIEMLCGRIIAKVIHLIEAEKIETVEQLNDYVQKKLLS